MQKEFGRLLRSKGFFWLATRNWGFGEWGQAGVRCAAAVNEPFIRSVLMRPYDDT